MSFIMEQKFLDLLSSHAGRNRRKLIRMFNHGPTRGGENSSYPPPPSDQYEVKDSHLIREKATIHSLTHKVAPYNCFQYSLSNTSPFYKFLPCLAVTEIT